MMYSVVFPRCVVCHPARCFCLVSAKGPLTCLQALRVALTRGRKEPPERLGGLASWLMGHKGLLHRGSFIYDKQPLCTRVSHPGAYLRRQSHADKKFPAEFSSRCINDILFPPFLRVHYVFYARSLIGIPVIGYFIVGSKNGLGDKHLDRYYGRFL